MAATMDALAGTPTPETAAPWSPSDSLPTRGAGNLSSDAGVDWTETEKGVSCLLQFRQLRDRRLPKPPSRAL